jgi:hypothetical protein
LADQIEVDDVALSVEVGNSQPGFRLGGRRKEGFPEFFRIGLPDSD